MGFRHLRDLHAEDAHGDIIIALHLHEILEGHLSTWEALEFTWPVKSRRYLDAWALDDTCVLEALRLDVRYCPKLQSCAILRKVMMQPWENGKNPNFGPNLETPKFFLMGFTSMTS